ncbi:PREDICTED: spermatogenesis-associated protein 31A6-like [Chrysochloris asiatica]|uniref:Spermatogenesis-associated protein 31A6-like n=1 Tax=Chrysochloris asiatica TaxID=185453 RepID=A0A9B0U6Y4_CHRAS|nr:PREDICTED: spermatogenesis-associated protein 31A6-like [Chrysochloris asiatica]
MENNYLFPLKSFSATWMSSSSTFWVVEIVLGFLCGVGLFFLLFPYLQSNPPLPPPKKNINIKKPQVETRRVRKRNKSKAVKACRSCLKELHETGSLISQLQNYLGELPDKGSFHQPSCQDASDGVHKRVPAEAHQPCAEPSEGVASLVSVIPQLQNCLGELPDKGSFHQPSCQDASDGVHKRVPAEAHQPCAEPSEGVASLVSVVPPSSSAVPLTQPAQPLPSALSRALMNPSISDLSPPPLALPPPHLPGSFACLQPPVLSTSPLPDATLTLSHRDSMAMMHPLSPLAKKPFPDDCWFAGTTSMITGLDPSSCPNSTLSWWQVAAKTLGLSTMKYCESQQEHTSCHEQEAAFWGGHADRNLETVNPIFPNPEVQKLLEIQVTKKVKFKIWEEKDQDESFPNQMSSGSHLNSLSTILKSLGDEQDTTDSQPTWSTKGKPQQLLSYQKTLQNHLQQKCSQLFWGLPFLHSESLVATVRVSGSTLEHPSILFNAVPNTLPIQMQTKVSPCKPQSLPHPVAQIQPLILTVSQCQAPPLAQGQIQAHLPSSLPGLPPSLPQFRTCGVSCPTTQNEAQSLISSEIQCLQQPLLHKQLESGTALSSVAKRSQETFHPVSPSLLQVSSAFQAHKSDSILPGDCIRPELRKQLEQHLRKRLMHHKWGLPISIQGFLEQPQVKLPRTRQAKDQDGPSWTSVHTGESIKDVEKMRSMHPGRSKHSGSFHVRGLANFQRGRDLGKDLGKVPKYDIPQSSENAPEKVLEADCKKESKNDLLKYAESNSENCALMVPHRKQLENTLKVHLSNKLGQIVKDCIPVSVHHSWLSVNHTLPKSDTYTKTQNVVSSESQAYSVNSIQEISFFSPDTRQVLEAHIVKYQVKHRWSLPLKVLKTINFFKARKDKSLLLLQSTFQSSVTHESWTDSRAEAAKFKEENLQASCEERMTAKKSVPTSESHLPASLPAEPTASQSMTRKDPKEEILRCTSEGCRPSVAMLKKAFESLSSRAEETRGSLVAKKSSVLQDRDILRTSVLAKSQNINVDLTGLGASRTSKRPLAPRMSVQGPGDACLKSQAVSEFEFKMESKPENQSQCCPTEMPLQDYASEVLLAADNLVCQISQSRPQSMSSGNLPVSQVLYDIKADKRIALRQEEESKIPCLQDSWKSQSKIFTGSDNQKEYRRPKPGECKERLAGLEVSQVSGISQLSQAKGKEDDMGIMSSELPPEKEQAPPENHFRKRMKDFLQWIFPDHKDKGQDDLLQKAKSVPASSQSHGTVKSRLIFTDRGTTEAQELMTTVGQILEEKMAFQDRLDESKLSQQEEETQGSQALVGGYSCCHRTPFYSEHRRVINDTASDHQATPESQSCSMREKQNRDGHSLKMRLSNEKQLCLRHSMLFSTRESMSPVSSQQHEPWMRGASGCPHHCPRHCLRECVFSGQLEPASAAALSMKTNQENTQSMPD